MSTMKIIVQTLFLFFSVTSLYMAFFFILLYFENRKKLGVVQALPVKLPNISIVVPAYNEEKNIADTIRSLKNLDYPKKLLEIVVVDDGSTDGTYRVAKRFKGIKLLRQKNKGKGAALNHGLQKSKGEIVAVIDADSRPFPDTLKKAIPFFKDKTVGGVTAAIFVQNRESMLERLQWLEYIMIIWARKLFEFIESIYVTPGPFSLYRREVLEDVGGFDETVLTEDIEVAWKLLKKGYKIRLAQNAKVLTTTPDKLVDWWRQRVRWNLGGFQTSIKYKYTVFKNDFYTLGTIVAPFFIWSYILSALGFFLFTYLVVDWTWQTTFFTTTAYSSGVNPMQHFEFIILPDIFTFFGLLVFILSIIWVKLGLKMIGEEWPTRSRLKNLLDLLIYLSLYITIFPINLFHSFWKYMRKAFEW